MIKKIKNAFPLEKYESTIELSRQAKDELRKVIVNQIGLEATNKMDDHDLNKIGLFLLTVLAETLKMKMGEEEIQKTNLTNSHAHAHSN